MGVMWNHPPVNMKVGVNMGVIWNAPPAGSIIQTMDSTSLSSTVKHRFHIASVYGRQYENCKHSIQPFARYDTRIQELPEYHVVDEIHLTTTTS